MLRFKQYLQEDEDADHYNERDADAEFEGLTELYDHIIHNKTIDPELNVVCLDILIAQNVHIN